MQFILIGWDAPDSREKRPAARAAHLEHWKAWDDAGRILLAGPMTDFAGSLLVVEAESEEEARRQQECDPYVAAGVFARTEIHPFRAVFPRERYGA